MSLLKNLSVDSNELVSKDIPFMPYEFRIPEMLGTDYYGTELGSGI